jgi:hypothetical protein
MAALQNRLAVVICPDSSHPGPPCQRGGDWSRTGLIGIAEGDPPNPVNLLYTKKLERIMFDPL